MAIWLVADSAPFYAALTAPTLVPLLSEISSPEPTQHVPRPTIWAAGLTVAGLPAALALLKRSALQVEIISLAVASPFQRLGIAGRLLRWLRVELQRLGYKSIRICYPLQHPSTAAMARLTDAQGGWIQAPGQRLVHFSGAAGELLLQRLTHLNTHWRRSTRFQTLAWSELTPGQLLELDRLRDQVPTWAFPGRRASDHDSSWLGVQQRDVAASQLLLDQGQPAGWIMVDRIGEAILRISQWWVCPTLQGRGIALMLLQRALEQGLSRKPRPVRGCFGIGAGSEAMLLLSRRHLEPLAIKTCLTQEALLLLNRQ